MSTVSHEQVALPSGESMHVTCINTGRSGPNAVVTANIHGDETTGVGVIHNLARCLPDLLLRGSVYLYPTLNPDGLAACSRVLPAKPTSKQKQ